MAELRVIPSSRSGPAISFSTGLKPREPEAPYDTITMSGSVSSPRGEEEDAKALTARMGALAARAGSEEDWGRATSSPGPVYRDFASFHEERSQGSWGVDL